MRRRSGHHLLAVLSIAALACSDSPSEPKPQPGMLQVSFRLTGNAIDGDGFVVTLLGQDHRVGVTDTLRLSGVAPGEYTIRVSDVAPHCATAVDSARIVITTDATTSLQIDADCYGRLVYTRWYGPADDQLFYLDERGDSRKLTPPMSDGQWQARWSPDGTRVVFLRMPLGQDSDIWIADLNGNAWPLAARVGDREMMASWSPDGQWVIYVHTVGTGLFTETDIRRVRPDGTGDHSLFRDGVSLSPVYSPDGQLIAFGCWRAEHAICYLTANGEFLGRAPAVLSMPQALAWSPAGSFIAVETIGQRQTIQLLRVATGEAIDVLPGQTSFGDSYWTPDGTQIALSAAEAGGNFPIYAVSTSGAGARRLADDSRWIGPWSPDGAKLPIGIEAHAFHIMDAVTTNRRVLMSGSDTFVRGWWQPHGTAATAALRRVGPRPHVEPAPAATAQSVRVHTDAARMTSSLVQPM